MDKNDVQDEPIEVLAEGGNVALAGPDGIVVVLSPEAAEETSDRLWKWAMCARRQQREIETSDQPEEATRPFMRWQESSE